MRTSALIWRADAARVQLLPLENPPGRQAPFAGRHHHPALAIDALQGELGRKLGHGLDSGRRRDHGN